MRHCLLVSSHVYTSTFTIMLHFVTETCAHNTSNSHRNKKCVVLQEINIYLYGKFVVIFLQTQGYQSMGMKAWRVIIRKQIRYELNFAAYLHNCIYQYYFTLHFQSFSIQFTECLRYSRFAKRLHKSPENASDILACRQQQQKWRHTKAFFNLLGHTNC